MTRDLDLLKIDFDMIAMTLRPRGASAGAETRSEGSSDGEEADGGG